MNHSIDRSLTAAELVPAFDDLRHNVPADDLTKGVGYISPWLVGGQTNLTQSIPLAL